MSEIFALGVKPQFFSKKALGAVDETREADALREENHMIFSPRCDFRCKFCFYGDNLHGGGNDGNFEDFIQIVNFTLAEFSELVDRLMQSGKSFKFTGGEITLIKNLAHLLGVVKQKGGTVYLDTNGSMPDRVVKLVRDGLVDVLGISIKGLNEEESCANAGIPNSNLTWNNPLTTIKSSVREKADLVVPVTLVVDSETTDGRLHDFADLLSGLEVEGQRQTRLKVNNFIPTRLTTGGLIPMNVDRLLQIVRSLVDRKPEWGGRITVVPSMEAVQNINSVIHF